MLDTSAVASVMESWVAETQDGWGEFAYSGKDEVFDVPNLGKVSIVDAETSGEGGGEATHVVFRVVMVDSSDRLFKKEGCYMSHYGNDWDGDIHQVRAVEKVVTDFVSVRG